MPAQIDREFDVPPEPGPRQSPGYFRCCQQSFPVPPRSEESILEVEAIVTTPERWVERPESQDPSWHLQRDTYPLVVAIRATL